MPTTSTYYLNAPSLASSTAVFANTDMTICAPDGFYTDGLVRRQQVGCVLLPMQACPECPPPSFNCISGECIDPGDGTGTYTTLEECDLMCPPPSISLGAAICRENNCNDNAACTIQFGITTANAPVGGYITVSTGFPSSTATITIINSSPDAGRLSYFEPSGSATPVYFTLELRTAGGTIIATQSTSLTHQSYYPMLPWCVIPITYNCVLGDCINPGDGTGTYGSLAACEAGCVAPTITVDSLMGDAYSESGEVFISATVSTDNVVWGDASFDVRVSTSLYGDVIVVITIINGNNTATGQTSVGIGSLPTISDACILTCDNPAIIFTGFECPPPPPVSYNCVSGTCTDPGDGSGTYATLVDCEAACTIPVTYNCVLGTCTDPGDGTGTYGSLASCEAACVAPLTSVDSLMGDAYSDAGEIFISATVSTDNVVWGDVSFDVVVSTSLYGDVTVFVTIINGNNTGTGTYSVGTGSLPTISDACISACSNPAIILTGFECVPVAISYNCVSGTCTDPGDGSGTYSTLSACEAACTPPPPPVSYNCISGDCIDPGDGTGTYSTLEECDLMCPPATISVGSAICRENNCNDNAACTIRFNINTTNAPVGGYITVATVPPSSPATVTITDSSPASGKLVYFEPSGTATPVYFILQLRTSGGTIVATQSTSLTHQSYYPMLPWCTIPVTYNCVSGTCTDPGDGTGTYSSLSACEAACTPPPPPVSYNCVSGTCTDPGDGSGAYSTLSACEAACTPPPPSINVTNVFANAYDMLGEISIDATVILDSNADVDSTFVVKVSTDTYGDVDVYVLIPNGTSSNVGSTSLGMGSLPTLLGDCISSCDNPAIVLTGFTC